MSEHDNNKALLELTVKIVSSHVANNPVASEDLPSMIKRVYEALRGRRRR